MEAYLDQLSQLKRQSVQMGLEVEDKDNKFGKFQKLQSFKDSDEYKTLAPAPPHIPF